MRKIQLGTREYTEEQLLNIISKWVSVDREGKYTAKARLTNAYTPDGERTRFLVNLNAATIYGANEAEKNALEALKTEDLNEASALWQKALNSQLTATIFTNDDGKPNGYIPQFGETVKFEVSNFETKEGEIALGVTANAVYELATVEAKSFGERFTNLIVKAKDSDFAEVIAKAKEETV